jgi:hypothetical protein
MKKLILIIAIAALALFYFMKDEAPSPGQNVYNTPSPATTTTPNTPVSHPLIRVSAPLPNTSVESPLSIVGEARGNWYFEASFPIKVLDADGKQIGIGHATAQGEWMTTNFVPFKATITFSSPRTETGTLVLEKDNPSGLPEHADEIRIPIRFSSVAPQASISLLSY